MKPRPRKSVEKQAWYNMLSRCNNPNSSGFEHYGGRGITVCARWQDSFESFLADMRLRPPEHSLDRIDNTRGYSSENCRWATREQQAQNRRSPRIISSPLMPNSQLWRFLRNRGISQKRAARATSYSLSHINSVLTGRLPLTRAVRFAFLETYPETAAFLLPGRTEAT